MWKLRPMWLAASVCLFAAPCHGWQPGYPAAGQPMPTRGFQVNTADRDDVVAFWHAVYLASRGYHERIRWNGSLDGRRAGSTSDAFAGDVERQINYFRAMCGVPASARVNTGSLVVVSDKDPFKPSAATTKEAAAQQAAMLIAASYDPLVGTLDGMTHDPAPDLAFWSEAAWNAAANGNLAFGTFGPRAITEYVVEELLANTSTSEWNSLVGHRRWILLPSATDFASGDFPGTSILEPPTNVLYVTQSAEERQAPAISTFVSYPPAGYFPVNLNGRFWSISRRNADFTNAQVTVRDASGKLLPVSNVRADNSYGDPALVWQMSGEAAANTTDADRRFQVVVTGILGDGVPDRHEYDVLLINPEILRRTAPIVGKKKVRLRSSTPYKVNHIAGARASRIIEYQKMKSTWSENGEGKKPNVIDQTSPVYPLLAKSAGAPGSGAIEGKKSFNLTFPTQYDLLARGVPEQIMELGTWYQPKNGSTLRFLYTRGLMSSATACAVEISKDQGSSWTRIGDVIRGNEAPMPDSRVFQASYKLPRSSKPIRIRFRYFFAEEGGAIAIYSDSGQLPTGIFLDDIKVSKIEWFRAHRSTSISGKQHRFKLPKKAKAGERWALALESDFGGEQLPVGPFRSVRVTK